MELRQLEYFRMVSRLASITKAADQMHIAQPSVTIAIQKLEQELGITLFDRRQRQIELTSEGRVFLQRVEEILNRLQDSVAEINDYRLLEKGIIKIGITPMVGSVLFPSVFSSFRKVFPHIELVAIEAGSLGIQKYLEQGRLDVGILMTPKLCSRLETLFISRGEILVCLSPDHPLSSLSSIPFSNLADQPFILHKEDTHNRQMILEECKKHQFKPTIVFSSSQIETILGLVEREIGISFLLDAVAKKHKIVQSIPLLNPLYLDTVLAWNKDRYLSNATKAFIDFIAANKPFGGATY